MAAGHTVCCSGPGPLRAKLEQVAKTGKELGERPASHVSFNSLQEKALPVRKYAEMIDTQRATLSGTPHQQSHKHDRGHRKDTTAYPNW